MLDYSLVELNDFNIVELEKLRIDAYQFDLGDTPITETFLLKI